MMYKKKVLKHLAGKIRVKASRMNNPNKTLQPFIVSQRMLGLPF